MDTRTAFNRAKAADLSGSHQMVFDWITAAKIIKQERPSQAWAGLEDDWENTGGLIYTRDGIPDRSETHTYLSSFWAEPQLNIDGRITPCWLWQADTEWDHNTYWPQIALDIVMHN